MRKPTVHDPASTARLRPTMTAPTAHHGPPTARSSPVAFHCRCRCGACQGHSLMRRPGR